MTVADQVVELLTRARRGLDDDQLAAALGVEPRQTVNAVCRGLRDSGVLRRVEGPDGKLVNELVGAAVGATPISEPLPAQPGDSTEQRAAEYHMLLELGRRLGGGIGPRRVTIGSARVELDGADEPLGVLVEIWAHQGPVKGAQRLKVLTDAFKLSWVAGRIGGHPRLIICMSDDEPASYFRSERSWPSQALRDCGITIEVVDLPDAARAAVAAAQARQFR